MPELRITPALIPANHTTGRSRPIVAIVDHVSEGSLVSMTSWFRSRAAKVSAHYGVGKDGTVLQYVGDGDTAWHAGKVVRPTAEIVREMGGNPNDWSIGIEHEGLAGDGLTPEQLDATARLHVLLSERHGIPLTRRHVIGHREIRADKTCPGRIQVTEILRAALDLQERPEPGSRVWSDWAGEHLVVTDYRADDDWSFLPESELRELGRRATTPFSMMPTTPTRS